MNKKYHNWTPEEDRLVSVAEDIQAAADLIGVTYSQAYSRKHYVRSKAYKPPKKRTGVWSDEEEVTLTRLIAERKKTWEIAHIMGRTVDSVYRKRSRDNKARRDIEKDRLADEAKANSGTVFTKSDKKSWGMDLKIKDPDKYWLKKFKGFVMPQYREDYKLKYGSMVK